MSEDKHKGIKRDKGSKSLLAIFLLAIIIILGLLLFIEPIMKSVFNSGATTIDDVHKEVLEGKETSTQYSYNGFTFVYSNDLWFTELRIPGTNKEYSIPMQYGPRELGYIPALNLDMYNFSAASSGRPKKIYVTFDPDQENTGTSLALSALFDYLPPVFNINIEIACTTNHTHCIGKSIIKCEDAEKATIFLNNAPGVSTLVELKGNCINLQGDGKELIKAVNRFLYQWYGIMN